MSIPVLRTQLSVDATPDGVVVVTRGRRRVELTDRAAVIWRLIDGRRTVEDIARQLAAEYGIDVDEAAADVREVLRRLARYRLLAEDYDVSTADVVALNRQRWDELATLHGDEGGYQLSAVVEGASSLGPIEAGLLGDVTGQRILHLQCHIGLDSVSLARMGARVTGVDFAPAAIAKATAVAQRAGVSVDFVVADAQELPAELRDFDIVFAAHGVFHWIPDIDRWMAGAFRALRPGGRLVVVDYHSIYLMLDSIGPVRLAYPYSSTGPFVLEKPRDWASGAVLNATTAVYTTRSPIDVANAAVRAGFRTEVLDEHYRHQYPGKHLTPAADGYLLRCDDYELPISFSLVGRR